MVGCHPGEGEKKRKEPCVDLISICPGGKIAKFEITELDPQTLTQDTLDYADCDIWLQ